MQTQLLGVLSLPYLIISILWLFLFVTGMAVAGPLETLEQVLAHVNKLGAPLLHAAIVARELGIPAVVGCFNATTLLKTGDRVRVDGARGIGEILR